MFFSLHLTCGKGLVFFLISFFIVEWLGTRDQGFFFNMLKGMGWVYLFFYKFIRRGGKVGLIDLI
jgi:hypothetical protein